MRRALLLPAALLLAAAAAPAAAEACDGKPVIMLVRGLIADRERLMGYARALAESGLYPQLSGYYLNRPGTLEVFEGTPPPNESILMVRFPCIQHARAFWHSRAYQEKVLPKRLSPSAGDFTVTVHAEAVLPDYMAGKVTPPAYDAAVLKVPLPPQKPPG